MYSNTSSRTNSNIDNDSNTISNDPCGERSGRGPERPLCTSVRGCVYMHVCIHIYLSLSLYIYISLSLYIYLSIYLSIYTYIYIYIYTIILCYVIVNNSFVTTQNTTATCVPSFLSPRSRTTSEVVVRRALGLSIQQNCSKSNDNP